MEIVVVVVVVVVAVAAAVSVGGIHRIRVVATGGN